MSRAKDLKHLPENNINLYDWFSLFVPQNKSKYVETFLRTFKNTKDVDSYTEEIKQSLSKKYQIPIQNFDIVPKLHIIMMYKMMDVFFDEDDMKIFQKFCEYNERGLIKQNDVSKYKEFEEIKNAVNIAEITITNKSLEKQTIIVYEDDVWLLVRPLTFASSRKYGASTKWCTTQETNQEYFHKYTRKGVLIYCLNKITGYKVASFYSLQKDDPEFSFWNEKDQRIDSLQTELPENLRTIIKDVCLDKKAKTNKFLVPDEERIKDEKLSGIVGGLVGTTTTPISNFIISGSTTTLDTNFTNNRTNVIRISDEEYGGDVDMDVEEQEEIPNIQYGSFDSTSETE